MAARDSRLLNVVRCRLAKPRVADPASSLGETRHLLSFSERATSSQAFGGSTKPALNVVRETRPHRRRSTEPDANARENLARAHKPLQLFPGAAFFCRVVPCVRKCADDSCEREREIMKTNSANLALRTLFRWSEVQIPPTRPNCSTRSRGSDPLEASFVRGVGDRDVGYKVGFGKTATTPSAPPEPPWSRCAPINIGGALSIISSCPPRAARQCHHGRRRSAPCSNRHQGASGLLRHCVSGTNRVPIPGYCSPRRRP